MPRAGRKKGRNRQRRVSRSARGDDRAAGARRRRDRRRPAPALRAAGRALGDGRGRAAPPAAALALPAFAAAAARLQHAADGWVADWSRAGGHARGAAWRAARAPPLRADADLGQAGVGTVDAVLVAPALRARAGAVVGIPGGRQRCSSRSGVPVIAAVSCDPASFARDAGDPGGGRLPAGLGAARRPVPLVGARGAGGARSAAELHFGKRKVTTARAPQPSGPTSGEFGPVAGADAELHPLVADLHHLAHHGR